MLNKVLAEMLNEIAAMVSLEDFPTARFEVRAYQKAALTLDTMQEPVEEVYRKGGVEALMALPGVGKSIASLIEEYIKTGRSKKYDGLKRKYPMDMAALTSITGMGAKKALTLYRELGVKDIDGLKAALGAHRISKLEGFGEKSEELIQRGLEMRDASKGRLLLGEALPLAESIVRRLEESGLVERAMVAGSARRMRETVGDIDILAISSKAEAVMELFTKMPEVKSIVAKGTTKSTVMLDIGTTCDLRALEPQSFGAAVQYFTGSKDHNVQVRKIAIEKGYKLNEYGLYDKKGRNIGGPDEAGIYGKLGMAWIPPEMREARGEVELAQKHRIPHLVEQADMKGDLHTHTKETDGVDTIEEMSSAAAKSGLRYMASTNHTKSLYVAKGMDDKGFMAFFKRVDRLNGSLGGKFTVLKGAEVDILKDGSLDLKNETLKGMDCVVASIHSSFSMPRAEMSSRIIRALDSGLVHIFAHPTGRVIGKREPYGVDLEKVAEAAERNGVAFEINAFPERTDLNDTNIMLLSRYKVMFAIDTDAHSTSHLQFMRYGVGTARRGWLTKERVLNALPPERLRKLLAR